MSALRNAAKLAVVLAGVVALLVAGGFLWLVLSDPADVRSEQLRQGGASEEAAARGRALLDRLAATHGYEAWRGHQTQEVVVQDVWSGGGSFWGAPTQRYRAQRLLGTFTSRLELLDGPRAGELWGMQSWHLYGRSAGGEPIEADSLAEFVLPTFQYFDELVFRLVDAPIVLDNGTGTYLGREHQRVFVTWGRPEPHLEHDQYDLWVDPDSGLMAVAYYSVRDAMKLSSPPMRPVVKVFGAGSMHYRDYREIDGVQVAFRQTVTLQPPDQIEAPLDQNYFHQLLFESAEFNSFDPDELVVDASRAEVGDAKPPLAAPPGDDGAERGFERPPVIRFGATVAEMERSLRYRCAALDTRRIEPPFLPEVERRQMQIDCDGLLYRGKPRWAEFVFRDDSLVSVWILTTAEEEQEILTAMAAAYGEPSHGDDSWYGFVDHRAALRRDEPEVFFYSEALDALYRAWFADNVALHRSP